MLQLCNKLQYFLKLGHFCDICVLQYDYRKWVSFMNKSNITDNGGFHISRNKIKEMCIMPTFIMKEIIRVIKENETTDIAIPLLRVVPGEYEEYAYQVLNSNADKERFNYPYISHRPFQYGDVYWIMEHQLQELEINGIRCFEEARFIPDEAIIHVKCSEYFFRCSYKEKRFFTTMQRIMWRNYNWA